MRVGDSSLFDSLPEDTLGALRDFAGGAVDAALVLGSGLGSFADSLDDSHKISASSIPGYPASMVSGHAGELAMGTIHGRRVLAFLGRLHGYEGHSAAAAALPARIAAALGAGSIIVTNAAGGLNTSFCAGDLMLINEFIVLPLAQKMGLPLHGPGTSGVPLPRPLFGSAALETAREAFRDAGVVMREGTYGFCSGPTYETRSEIAMFRFMGADAVGMSTVPELIVGARSGMRTIGISCITNKAMTVKQPVSHAEVTAVASRVADDFASVLNALIGRL